MFGRCAIISDMVHELPTVIKILNPTCPWSGTVETWNCHGKTESKPRQSIRLPMQPEDWPSLFERYLNAGDLEAIVALYEPAARFMAPSGEILVGREEIRPILAALIRSKTQLHGRIIRKVLVDDIALLYTDFEGTTVEASGKTVEARSQAIEVLRRQANGSWQLIIGDPVGRQMKSDGALVLPMDRSDDLPN
jgi:uncharacterized protein (TIGR02246 family)